MTMLAFLLLSSSATSTEVVINTPTATWRAIADAIAERDFSQFKFYTTPTARGQLNKEEVFKAFCKTPQAMLIVRSKVVGEMVGDDRTAYVAVEFTRPDPTADGEATHVAMYQFVQVTGYWYLLDDIVSKLPGRDPSE
jgi:uncharacterized protein YchJ